MRFREKYYSANLMKAVIYSNKPLPDAGKHGGGDLWSGCRTKNIDLPEITVPVVTDAQKGIVIHYVPALAAQGVCALSSASITTRRSSAAKRTSW